MAATYPLLKKEIVPQLVFNQTLYETLLHQHVTSETVWLEAGCGHKVLPSWREESEQVLVSRAKFTCGCDGDAAAITKHRSIGSRVVCDMAALPFKSNVFGLITSNMVVEHLDQPEQVFQEFARALHPKGVVIVHTPNRWSYFAIISSCIPQFIKNSIGQFLDHRPAHDYYPVRYRCNTPRRLREVFSEVGLNEIKLSMFASDAVLRSLDKSRLWGWLVKGELYLIRLSLKPRWRFLRVTLCGLYQKG
jgi:SAM-dependent methyltransferase